MPIEVFSRIEQKYLLTQTQVDLLLPILHQYMDSDKFNLDGKTYPISNIYFDTPADELIIKSLEKPIYKEKLRLRSYGQAKLTDTVFFELKKKYDGVVYKRRTPLILSEAYAFIENGTLPQMVQKLQIPQNQKNLQNAQVLQSTQTPKTMQNTQLLQNAQNSQNATFFQDSQYPKINLQVFKEIQNLLERYPLIPKLFLSYDRLAFFCKNDSDFRLTLDKNIQSRRNDLRLESKIYGEQLLQDGQWLMEAKAFKAFPLWFVHFLSEHQITQTSFSKYGAEFTRYAKNTKHAKYS